MKREYQKIGHKCYYRCKIQKNNRSRKYAPNSSLLTLDTTLLSSAWGGAPLTVFFLKPANNQMDICVHSRIQNMKKTLLNSKIDSR